MNEDDRKQAVGMHGVGDDWSKVPHSQRKDRPLSKDELRILQEKSDVKGLTQLGGNLAMIVATGACIVSSWRHGWWPLLVPLVVWQGFLICALGFACQHECIHNTAFKTRKLNAVVGLFASVPSLSFYYHELIMHKEHHTYTQDMRRDPELLADFSGLSYAGGASGLPEGIDLGAVAAAGRNGFKKVPYTTWQYVRRFLDFPTYLDAKLQKLVRCAAGQPVDYSSVAWNLPVSPGDSSVPGTKAHRLKIEARWQIATTLSLIALFGLVAGLDVLLLAWLLPLFVGPAPLYACQIHEHANAALDPDDGLSNTRTTLTSPLISFVMWHMGYHCEHHLYTTIPFHALPKAHALLKDKIAHVSADGHLGVNRSIYTSWISEQMTALNKAKKKTN